MTFELQLNQLDSLLSKLVSILPNHCVILLQGDLASGKTTLIQHLLSYLNIPLEATSPTFSIQNLYHTPQYQIFHYDFYRKDLKEILELGILEEFEKQGWHFVEWGEEDLGKILKHSGFRVVIITITKAKDMRIYRIEQ